MSDHAGVNQGMILNQHFFELTEYPLLLKGSMEDETHSLCSRKEIGAGCLDTDLANFVKHHMEISAGNTPACTLEGLGPFPPLQTFTSSLL